MNICKLFLIDFIAKFAKNSIFRRTKMVEKKISLTGSR
jgi:hypothetical protein